MRATITTLRAENAALRRRIADLTFNKQLNCPKREAIEDAWPDLPHTRYALILFDLDDLNALNYQYGWSGVDRRISAVWDGLRAHLRADDVYGQWQGGDEFVIAVPALDAPGLARRIQELLQFVGLSASRAIVAADPDLPGTVARAEALIKQARGGARGVGVRGVLIDRSSREGR